MKAPCTICQKAVTITAEGKYRVHGPRNAPCPGGGIPGPALADEQREERPSLDDDYSDALAALEALNSDEDADADERPGSDQESAALSDADNAEAGPEALLAQLNGAIETSKVVSFADWVPKDPAVRAVKEEHQTRIDAARESEPVSPMNPDSAQEILHLMSEKGGLQKQLNEGLEQLNRLTDLLDESRRETEQERIKHADLMVKYENLEQHYTQSRSLWNDAEKVSNRALELGFVFAKELCHDCHSTLPEPVTGPPERPELCKRCDYQPALSGHDLCRECQCTPPDPGEYGYCERCDYDTHICQACGEPVDHKQGITCVDCRARNASEEAAAIYDATPETVLVTEAQSQALDRGEWPVADAPSDAAPTTDGNEAHFTQAEFTDDGKVVCPVCSQRVSVTAKNEYRVHGPKAARCPQGGQPVDAASEAEANAPLVAQTVVTDPKDEARARGIRVPATPAFVGEQELPSLGATMALGHDPAIAMAIRLVQMQVPLACDIETEGLGNAARFIKSVTFSDVPEGRLVTILDPRDPDQAKVVRWVMDNAPELDFFNSPFDVPNLAINGLLKVEHVAKVTDLILYARQAEPDNRVSKSLEACAERYLGIPLDPAGLLAAGKAVGMKNKEQIFREMDLNRPVYVRGAAADAVCTARLRQPLRRAALTRFTTGHPFADWGTQGSEALHLLQREQVLNRMSLRRSGVRGLVADLEFLDEFNAQNAAAIDQKASYLTGLGIRPGVAPDLLEYLVKQDAVPEGYPITKKTKQLSGSKDDLALINHPVAQLFVQHKEQTHVLHDYLEKVRDHAVEMPDGTMRIFPVVNYLGATTGRQSVAGDPLQQFPETARGVILAEPGTKGLTSIDWSQIEPVTIANIAGQFDMLAGYESGDMDFYDALEKATGLPRKKNKTQLLGTLYGQGLKLTAAKLGVDLDEARRIKDAVFAPMPKVLQLTHTLREIGETHEMVPTVSGRIIPVPSGWYTDPRTEERNWSVQTHKAVNYFVQGSAYDLLAESAYQCEVQGYGDAIMLLMHDEVVCDTEAAEDIRRIMETPPERLIRHTGRTPVLRTDMEHMGERWAKV